MQHETPISINPCKFVCNKIKFLYFAYCRHHKNHKKFDFLQKYMSPYTQEQIFLLCDHLLRNFTIQEGALRQIKVNHKVPKQSTGLPAHLVIENSLIKNYTKPVFLENCHDQENTHSQKLNRLAHIEFRSKLI